MKKILILAAVALMLAASCCNDRKNAESNVADVVISNILERKSVRSYNGDTIPADVMENILRAAQAAPSGMDIRPWSFVVLTDKSEYVTIFAGNFNMKKFMESGAVVVICADTIHMGPTRENPDGPDVPQVNSLWRDDMGAVTENLLLAVEAYGLGACWTACYPFPETMKPVKESLGLPASVVPYAVVPIGYHDGTTQPKDKWDPTRVHYGRW